MIDGNSGIEGVGNVIGIGEDVAVGGGDWLRFVCSKAYMAVPDWKSKFEKT